MVPQKELITVVTRVVSAEGDAEQRAVKQTWHDLATKFWLDSAADEQMVDQVAVQGCQAG